MPPGPRGLEKIEIREGEIRSEAAKEIDVKVAPFVHPLPTAAVVPGASGHGSNGLDSFIAIGEKGVSEQIKQPVHVDADPRARQIIAQFKQADSFQSRWSAQPIDWKNPVFRGIATFLHAAFGFLLAGGGGVGGPLMIFGGLLFKGRDMKVATAEEFISVLEEYNKRLRDFDEAQVRRGQGHILTPEQEKLAADPKLEELSQERSSFVETNKHFQTSYLQEASSSIEVSDLYIGQVVDGVYRIEELIGAGGMGIVYRCRHEVLGKEFALKVLKPQFANDREAIDRFQLEAKAASAIRNPHIIDLSHAGRLPNGDAYIVMEYLDGLPLDKVIGDSPMPASSIIQVGRQLGEGLSAAHRAGIIHRDLKPENIFLVSHGTDKNFVKILDFGIAKIWSHTGQKITRDGLTIGTPEYMSPEQALGSNTDQRSDIYSMGVILYEMASGRMPFWAEDKASILRMQLVQDPKPFRELEPPVLQVPQGLEKIIFKAMAKKPEERYQSMNELVLDLEKLESIPSSQTPPEASARPPSGDRPIVISPDVSPLHPTEMMVARGRRWPLWGGFFAVTGLTGLIASILYFKESQPDSGVKPVSREETKPDAMPRPQVSPIFPDAMVPEPKKYVEITVEPRDAHVFQGGKDLGSNKVLIEIGEGTSDKLEIRRKGFKTKTLSLDASREKQSISLEREKAPQIKTKIKKPPPDKKDPDKTDIVVDPFKH